MHPTRNERVRQGKLAQALKQYEQILRRRPHSADAHYKVGALLLKRGRFDQAGEGYREALRIDPGHTRARRALDGR